ncbi:MAG: hypothetical protein GDA46_03185 [Bdellovibrionales bacterium]|nr:hypothetical protein [Bdellovibrionales bacterium]
MKKIIFIISYIMCFNACRDNLKMTPHFKPKKEVIFDMNKNEDFFISHVNFLFVLDISGSMDKFNKSLAENIELVLSPILKKYPYYNYNFAITTTSASSRYISTTTSPSSPYNSDFNSLPLFFNDGPSNCKASEHVKIKKTTKVGSYLNYFYKDKNQSLKSSLDRLLCILKENLNLVANLKNDDESFFQSVKYILQHSDYGFKNDFFGKSKKTVLFFISDSWSGIDYKEMLQSSGLKKEKVAEKLANSVLDEINKISHLQALKTYAIVYSYEKGDKCTSVEDTGATENNYPFHVYKLVEKTKGLVISICDLFWWRNLVEVSWNFLDSLKLFKFYLDEIPQLDTLEIYFNDKKIKKEDWFFNPENLSIELSSKFDMLSYDVETNQKKIKVKYNPFNINTLREE